MSIAESVRTLSVTVTGLALVALSFPAPAGAQVPEGSPTDLPVLSNQTLRGTGTAVPVEGPAAVTKTIDGAIDDWVGEPSRYGGTAIESAGEYIYQDHLFDANGPDDGRDTARFERTAFLEENVLGAYRVDALAQADAAGELGIPTPPDYSYNDTYGDATQHQDAADLHEVRFAASGDALALLARTTTMNSASDTGLLLLADTTAGSATYAVPFNSGLTTSVADVAVFITDARVLQADLATGAVSSLDEAIAVADAEGWTNAIEASLPLAAVAAEGGALNVALASGRANPEGNGFSPLAIEENDATPHANVANVAFRFDEPVRIWFELKQALALHDRTIDPFFTDVDLAGLGSQRYVPGQGYHDRIFFSPPNTGVPRESGQHGVMQHYGLYLPESYDGSATPLQWWLHWRGGSAHSGAAVVPKVMKQFGEDKDTIVVAPSGRGSSTWYVGRGHVDVLQVWRDVFDSFSIDRDRVYATGHSMGGWGSYLLTLLYPDRFAAAAPVAGPVTQGAWTGADFPGCDDMEFDGNTPCFIAANGSRPRDQFTRKLLENARHVPYAILHGTDDELVPYSGVARQAQRLVELGYRHRFYTYPGYEHYSHPIMDQWSEAASYLHSFTRPENPAQVTYKRDMLFERATEEVQSDGVPLNFDFDSAYWMSGLTPADPAKGTASFDGRSLAIAEDPYVAAPDSGAPTAPGQTGPYVIAGLQWLTDPTAEAPVATNGFDITLTGTSTVVLDTARMGLDPAATIVGDVSSDHALDLGLSGDWNGAHDVTIDGAGVPTRLDNGVLRFDVPSGTHEIRVIPPLPTTLSFTDDSADEAQYSDEADLAARLVTSEGDPVVGRTLTFTLGSQSIEATTGDNGVAVASLPALSAPGDHNATAEFAGVAGRLLPSTASQAFKIEREDSIARASVVGPISSSMKLLGTITDADSGAGVVGRSVNFYAGQEFIGTGVTNSNGVASVTVKKAAHRRENTQYTVRFAGDDFFLPSSDRITRPRA